MSSDFLPLEVGNRWIYEVQNANGQKIGEFDVSVRERAIRAGRSFYLLTQFPFLSSANLKSTVIRYDRNRREFLQVDGEDESSLFPVDGSSVEVLASDSSGLPSKFNLSLDGVRLTFERGVGIVEAQIPSADGVHIAKVTAARVGEKRVGDTNTTALQTRTEPERKKALADNVGTANDETLLLVAAASRSSEGHKLALTAKNLSNKLLPFQFDSGQTYDFAIIDPSTGQEIWRWSRRMFFSAVVRSEAIRPQREWKFEVEWNHRDNDLNVVPPGQYRVVGSITSKPSTFESEPITLVVP